MSLEIYASTSVATLFSLCEGTVEVFLPSSKRRLIAVFSKWFGPNITTEMSTINDSYISEFDEPNNELKLYRFLYGNDAQRGRNFSEFSNRLLWAPSKTFHCL